MEANKNNDGNKKILILSIIGILILVIAVVGVSFAMYKFTGTGTQTNVIKTGTVNMSFDDGDNTIEVTNEYPMTDAHALKNSETHKTEFTVTATWSGNTIMTIGYDIGIDANSIKEGTTLKKDYIKIALVENSTGHIFVGTQSKEETIPDSGKYTLTGGTKISQLENQQGSLIKNYFLANGAITTSGQADKYTLYAWVDESYNLPTTNGDSTTANNVTSELENGNKKQEKTTNPETFSFKLKVQASQTFSD